MPVDAGKLALVKYPDPRLRKVCAEVPDFNDELAAVARKMLQIMHEHKGVGLAGPQVGLLWRIFVCNPTPDQPENALVVVNPVIEDRNGAAAGEEGCLSLPDITVSIRRAQSCTLRAFDARGEPYTRSGQDLPARIWQHEFDHLSGRLILDYQSPADEIANRRALKSLETEYKKARKRVCV